MAKATLTLFLGVLALTSIILSFNAEARPQPSDEDLGIVIGPHSHTSTNLDDDELGIVIGPHEILDDETHVNLDDDDVGTIIGPEFEIHRHDFPEDFIFGTSVSAYQVKIHINKYTI